MSGGWLSKLFVFHPYRLLAGAVVDFVKCTGFLPMCSRLLEFADLLAKEFCSPRRCAAWLLWLATFVSRDGGITFSNPANKQQQLQHPEMKKMLIPPIWLIHLFKGEGGMQGLNVANLYTGCSWGMPLRGFQPGIRRDKSDLLYPFVGTTCLVCFNRESLSRSCSCFLRCWQGFCTALQNRSIQVSAIAQKKPCSQSHSFGIPFHCQSPPDSPSFGPGPFGTRSQGSFNIWF